MIRILRPSSRNTPLWPANYRIGMWAWLLQRITGVALVFYLFLHIWVISFSAVGDKGLDFDRALALLQTPFFIALDLLLLAAVLYHALNGIRILAFDLGIGIRAQAVLFWALMAVGVVALALGFYVLLPFIAGEPLV